MMHSAVDEEETDATSQPPLQLESTAAALSDDDGGAVPSSAAPDDGCGTVPAPSGGEGTAPAAVDGGSATSTEPFRVGSWRREAIPSDQRIPTGEPSSAAADAGDGSSPFDNTGTFRQEPMSTLDSNTTLVTVYHKRGVSHVEVDASDFTTGEKLKAFIRYKERKYDAVNRLNRICTFLVLFLFLNCTCRAIGLSNESWFSIYFPLSGRREGYGVFRNCENTVDIGTCQSWVTFPRTLIEATCTITDLDARVRTLWVFTIMDAVAVGAAGILALLTAFRPTRSKFHMAILVLCFISVPFGIIALALFRNLIGCVRGQCPALRGCEDGYGWGFTVYIVAVCASFIGASLASSMRSYVFVLRRTAKRELQLERRLQRAARRRGAVLQEDDEDDGNLGDDVELLRSDRVENGNAADDDCDSNEGDGDEGNATDRGASQSNAPYGDDGVVPSSSRCRSRPADGAPPAATQSSSSLPHHTRPGSTVRLMGSSGDGPPPAASNSSGGGGGAGGEGSGKKHRRGCSSSSTDDWGGAPVMAPSSSSPRSASYRTGVRHADAGTAVARRGHSRQASGASVGSNASLSAFQFGSPAGASASGSHLHHRGCSSGGDVVSNTSFHGANASLVGGRPPPQYITAHEMGVEIAGADDWVYAEDADMYYSFHAHMFWDPINREYYNCDLKRWQESLEP